MRPYAIIVVEGEIAGWHNDRDRMSLAIICLEHKKGDLCGGGLQWYRMRVRSWVTVCNKGVRESSLA